MAAARAARMGDEVGHSWGFLGAIAGGVVGALVGIAVVALIGAFVAVPLLIGAALIGIAAGIGTIRGAAMVHAMEEAANRDAATSSPTGPVPANRGGPRTGALLSGSGNVTINSLPAGRAVLDSADCDGLTYVLHAPKVRAIATGARYVTFNGHNAARVGDQAVCQADIKTGSATVIIGGESVQLLAFEDTLEDFLINIGERLLMTSIHALALGVAFALGPWAIPAITALVAWKYEEIFEFDLEAERQQFIDELDAKYTEEELAEKIQQEIDAKAEERQRAIDEGFFGSEQHRRFGEMVEYMTGGRITAREAMELQPFGGDLGPASGFQIDFGWGGTHALVHDTGGFMYNVFGVGPGYGGALPGFPGSGQVGGYLREIFDPTPLPSGVLNPPLDIPPDP